MSPGLVALPSIRFLRGGHDAVHLIGHIEARGQGVENTQDRRAARHVVAHLVHLGRGLQGVAAGVEGQALADQGDAALGFALGLVGQVDQLGRLHGSLGPAQQQSHLHALHGGLVEHAAGDLGALFGHGLGRFRQGRRCGDVARVVLQVAGEHVGRGGQLGHLGALGEGPLGPLKGDSLQLDLSGSLFDST